MPYKTLKVKYRSTYLEIEKAYFRLTDQLLTQALEFMNDE